MKTKELEWLPIDTAPKDRRILLFCPGLKQIIGQWCDDKYSSKPKPYWRNDLTEVFGKPTTRADQPTHWVELPGYPKKEVTKMEFLVALIKTHDNNKFLKDNCTHVKGEYWIYEGFNELLGDELTSHEIVCEGVVPCLGGMTEEELINGCREWFGLDVVMSK